MSVSVRVATTHERQAAEAFYRTELRRDVPLQDDQEVIVACDGDTVVGALRLCPEAGTLLLRTVVVASERRGSGVGRALLREASRAIGRRECWCFPWSYLDEFYAGIGLVRVPETRVPAALRHRMDDGCIATYRAARP